MFNILLLEPEIPPNTGNVIRLSANAGARLHLIGKLGFDLTEPQLRRAGLDYHDLAHMQLHPDLPACIRAIGPTRLFVVETDGDRSYHEPAYQPGDSFLFGPETAQRAAGSAASAAGTSRARAHTHAAGQPQPQPVELGGDGGLRSLAAERIWRGARRTREKP